MSVRARPQAAGAPGAQPTRLQHVLRVGCGSCGATPGVPAASQLCMSHFELAESELAQAKAALAELEAQLAEAEAQSKALQGKGIADQRASADDVIDCPTRKHG